MELQLGLALPSASRERERVLDLDLNNANGFGGGGEPMEVVVGSEWESSHHNHSGWKPESGEVGWSYSCGGRITEYGEECVEESVPMRTLPLLFGTRDPNEEEDNAAEEHLQNYSVTANKESTYLKVAMEGIGIGRKVDLSPHQSFHTLKHTLFHMFDICGEESVNYKLAYQDRGGDWVLAENATWRTFVISAQRLKILRTVSNI